MKILVALVVIIILFWTVSFLILNDFSFPTKKIDKYKKILLIFPHADDEVLTAGGLSKTTEKAALLILTKGERGTKNAELDLKLKDIRTELDLAKLKKALLK